MILAFCFKVLSRDSWKLRDGLEIRAGRINWMPSPLLQFQKSNLYQSMRLIVSAFRN